MNQKCAPCISASINKIFVYIRHYLGLELVWILFFAFAFFHAWGIWKRTSTWTMHHASNNHLVGQSICFWIRKFSTNYAVYIFDRVWLIVFGKEYENVCMWQPTLLKFNDIDSRNHASQNMFLVNVIDQLLQLNFEHSGYQIRSILRLLSEQQRSFDLRPLGITNECSKCIRAIGPSIDCHGILIIMNHVTWTYYERRWQNDLLFDGSNVIVTCRDDILKALIKICTNFFLIQA